MKSSSAPSLPLCWWTCGAAPQRPWPTTWWCRSFNKEQIVSGTTAFITILNKQKSFFLGTELPAGVCVRWISLMSKEVRILIVRIPVVRIPKTVRNSHTRNIYDMQEIAIHPQIVRPNSENSSFKEMEDLSGLLGYVWSMHGFHPTWTWQIITISVVCGMI